MRGPFRPVPRYSRDGPKVRWGQGRHKPLARVPPPDLQPTGESAGLMRLTNKGDGGTPLAGKATAALPSQRRHRRGQPPESRTSRGVQDNRTAGPTTRRDARRGRAVAERSPSTLDRIALRSAGVAGGAVLACVVLAISGASDMAVTAVAGIGAAASTTLGIYFRRR